MCINESLFLYKERLLFKQYIPSKRNRFGMQSFIVSDCMTEYIQNIIVYARSYTAVKIENKDIGKSRAIQLSFMKLYLGNLLFT